MPADFGTNQPIGVHLTKTKYLCILTARDR
jgi:hypothetical protein